MVQWKTHPRVLRNVHLKYLRSGSELIIANTYATNRHVMAGAGFEDLTIGGTRKAIQLALEAREVFLTESKIGGLKNADKDH